MTTAITILGLILALVGLIGCILPILPGPPLSFMALLILSYAKGWEPFSPLFLVIMGGLTGLVTLLDYMLPAAGAKKYGASRPGLWGSVLGLLAGLFILPPYGMFVGAFIGAVIGELLAGKEGKKAFRAGWGVLVGSLAGMGLKMALSCVMVFFYIKEMF